MDNLRLQLLHDYVIYWAKLKLGFLDQLQTKLSMIYVDAVE